MAKIPKLTLMLSEQASRGPWAIGEAPDYIRFPCEILGFDLQRFDNWLGTLPEGEYKTDLLQRRAAALASICSNEHDDAKLRLEFLHLTEFIAKREDFLLPLARRGARQVVAEIDAAPETKETAEQRQARRWQMCIDAGLKMPTDTYAHLPRGINKLAKAEGITRQAFTDDLNAYRNRRFSR